MKRLGVDFGSAEVPEWEGNALTVFEGFIFGEGGKVGSENFSVAGIDDFARGVH